MQLQQTVDIVNQDESTTSSTIRQLRGSIFGNSASQADRNQRCLSLFSTADFLCIARNQLQNIHTELEVYIYTFVDVTGKYTGQRFAIFDIEDVRLKSATSTFDCHSFMTKVIGVPQNNSKIFGEGYRQHFFRLTASSIFELTKLMKKNCFFNTDIESSSPINWQRMTGAKSFLNERIPSLAPFDWLSKRVQWDPFGIPNPDHSDIDNDIYFLSAYSNYEQVDKYFRINIDSFFPKTWNLRGPVWTKRVDAENCVIRISNLPAAVPPSLLQKKLLNVFESAGHVIGYAAYYLPPQLRDCSFVLIAFSESLAADRALSGHCYLYDNKFLIVQKVDLSFCSTNKDMSGNFLSVYADR